MKKLIQIWKFKNQILKGLKNKLFKTSDTEVMYEKRLKVCKECIEYNDIRFRVKNKINYVSNSLLKEQKSYKINRLIIVINKELNNNG